MTTAVSHPFQNTVQTISIVNSFHPSAQQEQADYMNVELDVEKRLQALVAKDRIRVKEFFLDFDKLRKGVVGEAAFRTCLGTLNIKFHESEIQALLAKYQQPDGPRLVNYAQFCKNIDYVFEDPSAANTVILGAQSSANFNENEMDQLYVLLLAIKTEIMNKRILIKPQFQDYDRTNSCHVTAEQFRRVMKELKLIPPNEASYQLLVRKYFDKGNIREVNYFKFCHDIDHPKDMFPQYVPKKAVEEKPFYHGQLRDAGATYFDNTTAGLDVINNRFMQKRVETSNCPLDIEKRLQAQVVMKRVRIEEFFYDFDKLRKGRVTKNQFEQVLSMLNFNLTKEEFDSLTSKYRTSTDAEYMVNYHAFCNNINAVFTTYGIQKKPTAPVAPVTVDNTVLARRKYLDVSEEEQSEIAYILEEYRKAVRIKRIHLKPMFQDFDITKNQHVTKHQFLRTLGQLGVSTSENVLNTLCKAYMDKGNVDEVNYFDFCNDIDSPEQLFRVGRDFNHSFDYYPKTRPRITGIDIKKDVPDDVEDIIAKLRQCCKEQRIRISEFFRDFDKLRSGSITEAQFRIGLNMSKIVLSGKEFRTLADRFQSPKEGSHILWREFSDCVDEVFTKKNLERSVDIQIDGARTQSFYGTKGPDSSDEQNVSQVLDAFRNLIRRERLDAKSFFQDPDRHNYFKVSPKQFKQTVTLLGVEISDAQLASIVKKYGNYDGDIQYMPFLKDCEYGNYVINEPYTGAKSTYQPFDIDFTGASAIETLIKKIKDNVMRNRIRLGEFLQDHDPLRKGRIEATKFRTTLYAQKIQLTTQEYQILEDYYRCDVDPLKIKYFAFNQDIEGIFTQKDLEKNPTKTLSSYVAPSILDPKSVLNEGESAELQELMVRIGTVVRLRRLLIKPFFQDKDKSKSGFVTSTRFRSIFDNQRLQLNDKEFNLINKRFQAGAANEINYVEFDYVMRYFSGDREVVEA